MDRGQYAIVFLDSSRTKIFYISYCFPVKNKERNEHLLQGKKEDEQNLFENHFNRTFKLMAEDSEIV